MTYRLGNQVEIVRGKHAAALYDYFGGRVQRIPLAAAPLLEQPAIGELAPDDIGSAFFQGLVERNYVQPVGDHPGEPFRTEWTLPLLPPLRTLSVDLDRHVDALAIDRVVGLVAEAVAGFGLLNVVLVVDGEPESLPGLAARLLALDPHLMLELLCSDAAWRTVEVPASDPPRLIRIDSAVQGAVPDYQHREGRRTAVRHAMPMSPEMLIGNFAYFHLLKEHGESHGCLHVDAVLRVFPDICERDYALADLRVEPRTVAELVNDERTQRYWSAAKDRREKCRDCEFRYACPNPVAHRSDADDLASAPFNCGYDLETGRWEQVA
jgi:radical SAM protein with 4Fe4S-binding SPASM domain